MDRLIAANSVNLAGADGPPVTGTPQYATDGNPALNIPATRWPAYQYNALQEEIMNVLIAAGIAPDKANNAQLLAALTGGRLGRTRLTGATTFHIATTGNDSTGDGTIAKPWLTFSHAVAVVAANYDLNSQAITFLSDSTSSTYTDSIIVFGRFVGQGNVTTSRVLFDFNGCTLNANSGGTALIGQAGAAFFVRRVTFTGAVSGLNLLWASSASSIQCLDAVAFGAASGCTHVAADSGGSVNFLNNYTVSGGANIHFNSSTGGAITMSGIAVTVSGTPAFTVFTTVLRGGVVVCISSSFSGSATGARYVALTNGVIDVNGGGANFFPGNSAGSTGSGGQYV